MLKGERAYNKKAELEQFIYPYNDWSEYESVFTIAQHPVVIAFFIIMAFVIYLLVNYN